VRTPPRLTSLLATLALATLACSAPTPAATGTAEDEQAIRAMADRYSAAYSARDTALLGAILADDYQDVDPTGAHRQGRNAFLTAAAAEFAMIPAGATFSMSAATNYIRWIDANNAVAGGTWGMSPAMPGMPSRGSWMVAVAKQDTTWKVVASLGSADITPLMPQAPPAKP